MRNPLRSEADAFRLVLVTIGYFLLIVIGSVINVWLGVAVFVVLTAAALWWLLARRGGDAPPAKRAPAPSPPEQHRVLVLANETVDAERLLAAVRGRVASREARALVVCPALTSPLREWASDVDPARADAQSRLDASLAALRDAGIDARGEIGEGDPVQAIEDAIRTFRPDELVVATPAGDGVVEKARERFAMPVTHVTADPR